MRDLIVGFLRADVPLVELDPFRRASADLYGVYDDAAPTGWARLAAWNGFLPHVYADNLVSACSKSRYVEADTVPFARVLYQVANLWLEEARKAAASPSYHFLFEASLPHPLPHWVDALRTESQLRGMRATLDVGRTRVASALARAEGSEADREFLHVRLAEIDAEHASAENLWTRHPTDDLRLAIAHNLDVGLDHAYALGQLLAYPDLIRR